MTGFRCARFALAGIVVLGFPSVAAAPAAACSPQWKVPFQFLAIQSNGYQVKFQLKQKGSKLWGKAVYSTTKRSVFGNVTGSISNNSITVRAYWTYSGVASVGLYFGRINANGSIDGRTHDQFGGSAITEKWYSRPYMLCG